MQLNYMLLDIVKQRKSDFSSKEKVETVKTIYKNLKIDHLILNSTKNNIKNLTINKIQKNTNYNQSIKLNIDYELKIKILFFAYAANSLKNQPLMKTKTKTI